MARLPTEYLRDNFHITTSGNFNPIAFACALDVMGPDRLMFSVDYPMDDNVTGAEFLRDLQVDNDVRRKVAGENALRLFGDKIPRR